jgi:Protein of unknown function (DUF2808)
MKRQLLYAAAMIIGFAVLAPVAKASSLVHSTAYPNRVKVANATYHVGLRIEENSLSQLLILVPDDAPGKIWFSNRIEVTDRAGHLINTTSSFDSKRVTIAFTQPVSSGTTLEIDLKGVRTSDLLGRTWLFPIEGIGVNSNQTIQLGTARIQTYK